MCVVLALWVCGVCACMCVLLLVSAENGVTDGCESVGIMGGW